MDALNPVSTPNSSPPAESSTPRKVLLLGLGNDILTDDAVGLQVARRLHHELAHQPGIEVRETTEMGLALLDFITGYAAVVIVDSIQTGRAAPGFVHELDAASLQPLTGRTPHFLGVSETLSLGRQLGLPMPDHVKVFAIEVEDVTSFSEECTPRVSKAIPECVGMVIKELKIAS